MRRGLDLKEVWLRILLQMEVRGKIRGRIKKKFSKINKGGMTSVNKTIVFFGSKTFWKLQED